MMSRVDRWWRVAGVSLALLAGARSVNAQIAYRPDDAAFEEQLAQSAWHFIAKQPCENLGRQTSLLGTDAARRLLLADLARRLGRLPPRSSATTLQSRTIYRDSLVHVDLVVITGRFRGTNIVGYLAQPNRDSIGRPAAVVLQGANSTPAQAFGWRGDSTDAAIYATTPLNSIATALVSRGYVVFVPFIDDDYEFQPILPWIDLENLGFSYRSKTGSGGVLTILTAEAMASVDYVRSATGAERPVALVGWEEGAFLASLTAAIDPRVGAVVELMPPRDARAMRSTIGGTRVNAPFDQYDCAIGNAEQAALISPRPLLFAWADDDVTLFRSRPFMTADVRARILQRYEARPGAVAFLHERTGGPGFAADVSRWLRQRSSTTVAAVADSLVLPQPRDLVYPSAEVNSSRSALANYIGSLGVCRELTPNIDASSATSFALSADTLRERVRAELHLPISRQAHWRIQIRQRLREGPDYRLEWLYITSDGESGSFGALLATPLDTSVRHPAVISFDGNYGVAQVFGLKPFGVTAYLGAYGAALAQRGYVVIAPSRPAFVSRGAPAIFAARGARTNRLAFEISLYRTALDVLLQEPEVDTTDVIAYGISEAAYSALYTTVFEPRITGLVFSNPLVSHVDYFGDPLNVGAGVWQTDLCTTADDAMMYLIAPRRFTWEGDDTDLSHYPSAPLSFPRAIQELYRVIGADGAFHYRRHMEGHETHVTWLLDIFPSRHNPGF